MLALQRIKWCAFRARLWQAQRDSKRSSRTVSLLQIDFREWQWEEIFNRFPPPWETQGNFVRFYNHDYLPLRRVDFCRESLHHTFFENLYWQREARSGCPPESPHCPADPLPEYIREPDWGYLDLCEMDPRIHGDRVTPEIMLFRHELILRAHSRDPVDFFAPDHVRKRFTVRTNGNP